MTGDKTHLRCIQLSETDSPSTCRPKAFENHGWTYIINISMNKLQHRNMIIIWPSHCPYMVAFDMSRFSWMSRKCVLSWFHPLTSLHQNSGGHIFLWGTKISSIETCFFGWNRLGPPWNPWGAYWFLSPPAFGGVLWCASHLVSRLKSIYNII